MIRPAPRLPVARSSSRARSAHGSRQGARTRAVAARRCGATRPPPVAAQRSPRHSSVRARWSPARPPCATRARRAGAPRPQRRRSAGRASAPAAAPPTGAGGGLPRGQAVEHRRAASSGDPRARRPASGRGAAAYRESGVRTAPGVATAGDLGEPIERRPRSGRARAPGRRGPSTAVSRAGTSPRWTASAMARAASCRQVSSSPRRAAAPASTAWLWAMLFVEPGLLGQAQPLLAVGEGLAGKPARRDQPAPPQQRDGQRRERAPRAGAARDGGRLQRASPVVLAEPHGGVGRPTPASAGRRCRGRWPPAGAAPGRRAAGRPAAPAPRPRARSGPTRGGAGAGAPRAATPR